MARQYCDGRDTLGSQSFAGLLAPSPNKKIFHGQLGLQIWQGQLAPSPPAKMITSNGHIGSSDLVGLLLRGHLEPQTWGVLFTLHLYGRWCFIMSEDNDSHR